MSTRYPNEAWIAALKGQGEDAASRLKELSDYLQRVLGSTLRRRNLDSEELTELGQEAMTQLLGALHTFRGDSAFTTWAAAVATRVAFTELRRKASRETKHAAFAAAQRDALERGDHADTSGRELTRRSLVSALHAAIDEELTERQRIATLALLRGVPTIEIAEQMSSNQNAVYKLVHDARIRLRDVLERKGMTPDMLDEAVEGGAE